MSITSEGGICQKFSLSVAISDFATIPKATVEGILSKAEKLLNDPKSIVPAPGNNAAYMVVSQSLGSLILSKYIRVER